MNSIAYVQRQINEILRPIKNFAAVYMNNIVLEARSL